MEANFLTFHAHPEVNSCVPTWFAAFVIWTKKVSVSDMTCYKPNDGLLCSYAYTNITNIGIKQSDSDIPSASSLITSRLGSEYLDFMANKERVVDLL